MDNSNKYGAWFGDMQQALIRGCTRKDSGSGTVSAIALICCIGVALTVSVMGGTIVVARAQAQTAADAAALAAATAWREGDTDPCDIAGRMARANTATLAACAIEEEDVIVTAKVQLAIPLLSPLTYESRAGPEIC